MPPETKHVYAHFPFCDVICHYCDFYVVRAKHARYDEFVSALERETRTLLPKLSAQLEALYLGGGTPALTPLNRLADFLSLFAERITPQTEVTLEANPANINRESLRAWAQMGINRLSLGVQSLDDHVLKRLGRVHSGNDALEALALAREYFPNVSGDLIYGVPGQDNAEPARHARAFAEVGATHVSAYQLTLPSTHFLYSKLPADDFAWAQIKAVADSLGELGFEHYEISNFGLPGQHSRNNTNYWRGGPYGALGPSASGFDGQARRWKNVADWQEYCARLNAGVSPVEEEETLRPDQRQIEALFTSLRTSRGLDLRWFQEQFQVDLLRQKEGTFQSFEKDGLGTLANGHFVLTFAGRMLADEIVRKLM